MGFWEQPVVRQLCFRDSVQSFLLGESKNICEGDVQGDLVNVRNHALIQLGRVLFLFFDPRGLFGMESGDAA